MGHVSMMLCGFNGSDNADETSKRKRDVCSKANFMLILCFPSIGEVVTNHILWVMVYIIFISLFFFPASRGLLVLNAGSKNYLVYKNASLGNQVLGIVSRNREEVWLYEFSWKDKLKVTISLSAFRRLQSSDTVQVLNLN